MLLSKTFVSLLLFIPFTLCINPIVIPKLGISAKSRKATDTDTKSSKYGPFYLEVPLDHFSNDTTTFYDRYWVNTEFYKPNGPIILMSDGESTVTYPESTIFNSSAAQVAKRLNGIVLLLEHRFYGESKPNATTFTDSDTTLYGLTADQALADMASLLTRIKFPKSLKVPPVPQTKVIVFGCSYSGSLAAWMREKYPQLVHAAVAGSAPVQAQVDFYQYFDPIIRYGSKQCINTLEEIIAYVDKILFGNSTENVKQLKKFFYVDDLYDDDFASYLTTGLNWQYASNTTYNAFDSEFCTSVFDSNGSFQSAINFSSSTTAFERSLISYSEYLYASNRDACKHYSSYSSCFDSHNITSIDIQMDSSPDNVAWSWQFCTEFGYFQVSPPENHPTIVSRKYTIQAQENYCKQFFRNLKIPAYPDVQKTNDNYKGWNVDLDRVIWIDGEYDNWRELSVHSPLVNRTFDNNNPNVSSIIISKASHCVNWNRPTSQYLQGIQDQQYTTLSRWLQQS